MPPEAPSPSPERAPSLAEVVAPAPQWTATSHDDLTYATISRAGTQLGTTPDRVFSDPAEGQRRGAFAAAPVRQRLRSVVAIR